MSPLGMHKCCSTKPQVTVPSHGSLKWRVDYGLLAPGHCQLTLPASLTWG